MTPLHYLKRQSKKLIKDYKTKTSYIDKIDGYTYYKYDPKYFDMDSIVCDFDIDEENFTLMNAQHIITRMVGFYKWTDLEKASQSELELAKLLFDNQHKLSSDEWDIYLEINQQSNNKVFDADERLEIFKVVFLNVDGHVSSFADYRLKQPITTV